MRFRKKPVDVEAVQWFPGVEVAGVYVNSMGAWVETANGWASVARGTWIVTDPNTGDRWPVAEHIFAATYEPADDAATPNGGQR